MLESEAVLLVNITRTGRAGDQVSVELESRTFFSENPAQGLSNTAHQYCTTIYSCEVSDSVPLNLHTHIESLLRSHTHISIMVESISAENVQ